MEAQKLRKLVAWFTLVGDNLYKRSPMEGAPLQKCTTLAEGRATIQETHDELGAAHQVCRSL